MTRTFYLFLLLILGFVSLGFAQKPAAYDAVDIYNKVQKLDVLGSVLYIAAHPDDENTRLISYFANEKKVRTAYLSLTRGDGGQNLIGTEIWEKLGLIRTNELLMARSVDGGHQYFSRANDFGYSKHPDETLAFWNKDEVMHDIIKVIREFKPDIIVNRFDPRRAGQTHGHHTSSAILSVEAFDLAGDPEYLAERLSHLSPWQPEREFWNTGWWFYGGRENFENADKSNLLSVDAGVYYPMLGTSNTEIAARSRTMHKSQGFGSTGSRGSELEYLELIKGSAPLNNEDPLSGIDLTWNRVTDGAIVSQKINKLLTNFNYTDPSKNVPQLIDIYRSVEQTGDAHWRDIKLAEIKEILLASTGLYLEATSQVPDAVPGDVVGIELELINRSHAKITAKSAQLSGGNKALEINASLIPNERKNIDTELSITEDTPYSNPYWLDKKGSIGMYHVANENLIGQPISSAAYEVTFNMDVEGLALSVTKDLVFKRNDPVDGEMYSPFYIKPQASVSFSDPIYIFSDREPKQIPVIVKAFKDNFKGVLSLKHPASWIVNPKVVDIEIEKKGQEKVIYFTIKGPVLAESSEFSIQMLAEDGTVLNQSVTDIKYDHIPDQVLVNSATAKFERLSIDIKGENIAYLQGAGDDIPQNLRQIGYHVTEIDVADVTSENLKKYDALVMGIRAYNTKKELLLKKDALMDYMNKGGTVIVQYNTSRGIDGSAIAPYPMELSRDRVTDELAKISFVDPNHEVLNYPNKISSRDFEGWVQERGLYFPDTWDERYAAPLACNDAGEPSRQGGLLIGKVGEGHFIYTGYSWFRQLPAGVSGAFRLFANMLSIGKNEIAGSTNNTGSND